MSTSDNKPNSTPPFETGVTDNSPVETGLTGRNSKGQFGPGNSANPKGRPLGSRNRASLLARALLEEKAGELTQKVMEEALNGNPIAYKLCIERLVPIPQDAPIALHLPEPGSKASETAPERMFESHNALIRAVANGDITPHEAQLFSQLFEARRRSWEALEVHRRLEDIENRLNRTQKPGSRPQ